MDRLVHLIQASYGWLYTCAYVVFTPDSPYNRTAPERSAVGRTVLEDFAQHLAREERSPLPMQNYRCDLSAFARPATIYRALRTRARRHLWELGAPEPTVPLFDAPRYEPIPEVELDPEGEFHVGNITDA